MKHMRKIVALALALIMALALATTAFAADVDITITDSASGASVKGHTYEVYQIFTGVVAADGVTLSDVEFGANFTSEDGVDAELAKINAMDGAAAAAYLNPLVTGTAFKTLNEENEWKATVATGYYLIVDVSTGLPAGETASAFVLEVIGNTTIKSKHTAAPVTYKKVDDINDSTGEGVEIEWHDSADHDIGDEIDFQLNAVLPSSFDAFRTEKQAYPFTFHDVECEGLDFVGVTRVYIVNGTDETVIPADQYTVNTAPAHEDCTFHVVFSDLTQVEAAQGGSKLVVEYKSKLNDKAVIGSKGNPNKMYGEYRNLGYPETPAYTPEDLVIVFTFKADVNKVDPEQKPLSGAEFILEKYDLATETWKTIALVEDDDNTVFSFKGLDDGRYRITETKAPDGYNSIDPIYFTVTAEHDVLADDPKLTNLAATATKPDGTAYTEAEMESGNIASFTVTKDEGKVETSVVNEAGVELPETGGMGTTLFYIIGGLLVAGAAILLITKKRMSANI